MKNTLLFLFACLWGAGLWAQNYNMTNGNVVTCSGNFYDSGGPGANYANNQNFVFTICPSTPGARVQVNFTSFNIEDGYDFLEVFDGNSVAAPTLGTYTGLIGPGLVSATPGNPTGCITFRFTSDFIITAPGWVASISCVMPCQTINAVLNSVTPAPGADGIIRVCQGGQVTFTGSGNFSSSGAGATYQWQFGNGTNGAGTTATGTYTTPGSYTANLIITDPMGCTNNNFINQQIHVSTTPTINTSNAPDPICLGQTSNFSATVTPTTFTPNCTPPVSGTTFLPDGSGVSYQTSITVNCYASGQTITSASDIQNVCLNMEHSYLGDLQMELICPNGQTMVLKAYPGGGALYLGSPIDDGWGVGPGVGATYCFTPSAGTLLVSGPTTITGTPPSASIIAGNYMPVQSFNNMIGCPINGNWTIRVTDNLASDDGYIFFWDLNFNPAIPLSNNPFTPSIVSQGWVPATGLTTTGPTTATVLPNGPGNPCYTYSVTDNFGCTYTQNECMVVNDGPTGAISPLNPTTCPGASVNLTAPAGNSYQWSTGATGASINVNPGVPTSYTVTVTAATGCTATFSSLVTPGVGITVPADVTNVACNGQATGAIDITPTGGNAPYTYNWGGGITTEDRSNLTAGSYTVTVNDLNSCTATATFAVTQSTAIDLTSTNAQDANCNGAATGCATITPSGGFGDYGYIWSASPLNASSICNLAAGTYTVTVTDTVPMGGMGGMAIDTAYFETFNGVHNWTLNVATGPNDASANFWEVDANEGGVAVGGCGVANNGDPTLHITSQIFPGGGAAYNAGGLCPFLCVVTNRRAESPQFSTVGMASPTLRFDYIANGQALLDNASVWYNDGSGWNQLTASIKSPTCPSGQGLWTLYNTLLPASCANNPNVRVAINWTNNDDATGSDPSVAINNLMVVDTSAAPNNVVCTAVTTITINQPSALNVSVDNVNDALCNGANSGSIDLSVSGGTAGYTYAWSSGPTSQDLNNIAAGNYTVTVTDANGCQSVQGPIAVNQPSLLDVDVTGVQNASCAGQANGSIDIIGNGGTPGYSFLWSNGSTNQNQTGLLSGVYTVTITDANGCTATDGTTVGEATAFSVSVSNSNDPSCNGLNDGSVAATANGGTPGYTFVWNGGSGSSLSNLGSGTFTVTATDANGCSATATVTLTEPTAVSANIDPIQLNTSCGNINDGQLAVIAGGGTGTLDFAWSSGQTSAGISGLAAGNYTVTVTDDNGCQATASATITSPLTPTIAPWVNVLGTTNYNVTANTLVDIGGGASSQAGQGVVYAWSIVGTAPGNLNLSDASAFAATVQPDADGTYTLQLTATSADGCVVSGTIVINVETGEFLGMPSAFTPNGDGQNDVLRPVRLDAEYISEFRIYNRFGQKVYDNASLSDGGWDGTLGGQPQARDAYLYVLTYQLPGEPQPTTLRGEVILVR